MADPEVERLHSSLDWLHSSLDDNYREITRLQNENTWLLAEIERLQEELRFHTARSNGAT